MLSCDWLLVDHFGPRCIAIKTAIVATWMEEKMLRAGAGSGFFFEGRLRIRSLSTWIHKPASNVVKQMLMEVLKGNPTLWGTLIEYSKSPFRLEVRVISSYNVKVYILWFHSLIPNKEDGFSFKVDGMSCKFFEVYIEKTLISRCEANALKISLMQPKNLYHRLQP